MEARSLLRSLFDAAVVSADPYGATRRALVDHLSSREGDGRGWVIAVGKASDGMARAALAAATDCDLDIAGGMIVCPAPGGFEPLEGVVGDHPLPGARSHRAAMRIGALAHAVLPSDHVLLVVSGGTSSLIAAPAEGVDPASLAALFRALLGAGGSVDINVMNAIRRRFLQWGAGRLAVALAPACIHQVLLSDVVGDDPAAIGSGPAVPDPLVAQEVLDLLESTGVASRVGRELPAYLQGVIAGHHAETPKATDAAFVHAGAPSVIGRESLHAGITGLARTLGLEAHVHRDPLVGEARERGIEIARWLSAAAPAGVHCWSGETTVTLGDTQGRGGRCQEFALAAALELEQRIGSARRITLLAAGTDGRDGPTDAAGAFVDPSTAAAIRDAGLAPGELLARHDAYRALDAAGALLRTGPTGTNVADVVLAVVP